MLTQNKIIHLSAVEKKILKKKVSKLLKKFDIPDRYNLDPKVISESVLVLIEASQQNIKIERSL